MNIAGNWQLNTASSVQREPLEIAGSIAQSKTSLSGAVHVDSPLSHCFDPLTTMELTGTLTGGNISLTSTSVGGQVTSLKGMVTNNTLTGTYTVKGGCDDGDEGSVTGVSVPSIANQLNGTFTGSGGQTFDLVADLAQGSASPAGSFGFSGTATFTNSCLGPGTIMSGIYPSGSFMIGTRVALEIKTDNGTVTFLGTSHQASGEISGDYTISGSTCDQAGTAVLVGSSPWDY
jgi:hypothetical protein